MGSWFSFVRFSQQPLRPQFFKRGPHTLCTFGPLVWVSSLHVALLRMLWHFCTRHSGLCLACTLVYSHVRITRSHYILVCGCCSCVSHMHVLHNGAQAVPTSSASTIIRHLSKKLRLFTTSVVRSSQQPPRPQFFTRGPHTLCTFVPLVWVLSLHVASLRWLWPVSDFCPGSVLLLEA